MLMRMTEQRNDRWMNSVLNSELKGPKQAHVEGQEGSSTDPRVQRKQPHLHAPQPLSQRSDVIPELTLPLAQVFHVSP